MPKPLTKADRDALHSMVAIYGREAVAEAMDSTNGAASKIGRPPTSDPGNALAVWIWIEAWRSGGKNRRVSHGIDHLTDLFAAFTVGDHVVGRSRIHGLYYAGKRMRAADPKIAAESNLRLSNAIETARACQGGGGFTVPLLFFKSPEGDWQSVIVDTHGRGGK